uniref:Arrestin-like N-terminal domain-containing protein n=1 Tax=Acrobeloides nanus TaxID=290746 RepID=A0A914CIG6_9BILA
MGKFKEFSINFDSNEGLYLPGQYVRGQVKLDLEYEVKAKSLVLIVYGKAYNNWQCREHSKKFYDSMSRTWKTKAEIYPVELDETYIDRKFVLWNSSRDEESISSGVNNFNFDFIIPSNCPPSFEGKYGSIRYYCKAELERPSKSEKKATASFTVLSNLDLNSTFDASRPVSMEKSSNLGLFFRQGSVFLKVPLLSK